MELKDLREHLSKPFYFTDEEMELVQNSLPSAPWRITGSSKTKNSKAASLGAASVPGTWY